MRDYSSQKNEIETIKPRTITVNLSDADVKRLAEKSGEGGLTISELLENFIGDLVDGTCSVITGLFRISISSLQETATLMMI